MVSPLDGQAALDIGLVHAARPQPRPLGDRVAIDEPDRVTALREAPFHELDGLDDHERVTVPARPAEPLLDEGPDTWMDDGLEVVQRGRIGKDKAREGGPVEGPRRLEDVRPETIPDGGRCGLAGLRDLTRQRIGIDRGAAKLGEHAGHGRLPTTDGAGQADDEGAVGRPGGRRWVVRTLTVCASFGRPLLEGEPGVLGHDDRAVDIGQLAAQTPKLHEVGLDGRIAEARLEGELALSEPGQIALDALALATVGVLGEPGQPGAATAMALSYPRAGSVERSPTGAARTGRPAPTVPRVEPPWAPPARRASSVAAVQPSVTATRHAR